MPQQIEPPAKGQPTNRLWITVEKCTKAINALGNVKVVRQKADDPSKVGGEFKFADGNAVLKLTDGSGLPTPPTSGIYALIDRDGTVSWEPVCSADSLGLKLD
jgi:hypothetical protein